MGRTLGGASVATIQGLVVFALTLIFGFRPQNFALLPEAFIFIFVVALLFTGLGTAIASLLEDMQGFQLIMNFLVMPIFFLSGALFPLRDLPKVMEIITKIDPLTYGIDGLRNILIGTPSVFGITTDLSILVVITVIILGIASYLFSKIQV